MKNCDRSYRKARACQACYSTCRISWHTHSGSSQGSSVSSPQHGHSAHRRGPYPQCRQTGSFTIASPSPVQVRCSLWLCMIAHEGQTASEKSSHTGDHGTPLLPDYLTILAQTRYLNHESQTASNTLSSNEL